MTIDDLEAGLGDPSRRRDALRELGETHHPEALSAALRYVADEGYESRMGALECIALLKDPRGLPAALAGLRDAESLVRVTAIEAIVGVGSNDAALPTLLEDLLSDEDEGVRAYAGWALSRLGREPASSAKLRARLDEEESAVARGGILEGLYRLTGEARYMELLFQNLRDPDGEGRAFTSNSLVGIASRDNARRLIEELRGALDAESYPAIREVLQNNLEILERMDRDDDFELD